MKKLISFALTMALALGLGFSPLFDPFGTELTVSAYSSEDSPCTNTSGTCGENLTWTLSDGVVTISGTGEMTYYYWDDFNELSSPFAYRKDIDSIIIENGVTSISGYAFYHCSSLTSVKIPDSVTSISWAAFSHCSSLKSVNIPDSVTSIGAEAFYHCSSLKSVNIPDSVTSISGEAFYHCSSLTSLKIPDSVTSIGFSAFSDCYRLPKYMVIPPTVKEIYSRAIGFTGDANSYYSIDNYIIYGVSGSAAEEYALKHGMIFVDTEKPVTISEKEYALRVGNSTVLSVDNFPGDVVWRSSDKSVADVSMGYISAKAPGTAVIYAEAGKDTLSC